ncbi:hypothetical protein CVS40_5803 [Lucilia cuprina]|nr:hypothetical protein CVS40_5803 [Lucilia cuprina]
MATKRKCKYDIQQLATYCSSFDKILPESLTLSLLEVKQTELERRWTKMIETFEEYIVTGDKVKEEESHSEIYLKYEEVLGTCLWQSWEMSLPLPGNQKNRGLNRPSKYCRRFKEWSLGIKRLTIINKGYCLNCLAFDHENVASLNMVPTSCVMLDITQFYIVKKILSNEVEVPLEDGPCAQKSKFGWIIYGPWKGCICHSPVGVC